jgi:DNA-binding MarR family transcriptional regulator
VERLEKAGLVTREAAAEDRRGAYAVLTEAGATRLHSAMQAHVTFVRQHFLSYFDDQELRQMASFWRRLAESGSASPGQV